MISRPAPSRSLFTDIEGSTRLLHELGERYAEVLAETGLKLDDRNLHERAVSAVRGHLADDDFASWTAKGQSLTLDEVVALALSDVE